MAFCSKCGTEINNGVKFCPNCGTQLDGMNGTQRVSNPVQGEPKKKMALWKKIGIGFIIFAIIGALSQPKDGKTKSNDETNAPQKTEKVSDDSKKAQEEQARQAKEEAERQAREEKAKKEREKQKELQSIMEYGYYCGTLNCTRNFPIEAKEYYVGRYGAPKNDEELEYFRKFKQEYERGMTEGREAKRKMDNM